MASTASVLSDLNAESGAEAVAATVPESALAVAPMVSDATADELRLVNAPHGLIELGAAEMELLATGPAPSELQIRNWEDWNAADTTNTDHVQVGGSWA